MGWRALRGVRAVAPGHRRGSQVDVGRIRGDQQGRVLRGRDRDVLREAGPARARASSAVRAAAAVLPAGSRAASAAPPPPPPPPPPPAPPGRPAASSPRPLVAVGPPDP